MDNILMANMGHKLTDLTALITLTMLPTEITLPYRHCIDFVYTVSRANALPVVINCRFTVRIPTGTVLNPRNVNSRHESTAGFPPGRLRVVGSSGRSVPRSWSRPHAERVGGSGSGRGR